MAENAASIRILTRLGFVRTAVHPGAFCREGRRLDIWDYALRPEEETARTGSGGTHTVPYISEE